MTAATWPSANAACDRSWQNPGQPNPFAKITTPAARGIGWTVSSIDLPRHCGSALETKPSRTIWNTHFLDAQSLSSEISPKEWTAGEAEQSPPGAPEILTGSASQEGSRRLL